MLKNDERNCDSWQQTTELFGSIQKLRKIFLNNLELENVVGTKNGLIVLYFLARYNYNINRTTKIGEGLQ